MEKKKDKIDTPSSRRQIVLAFWIAAILLIADAIRYFVELCVNSIFNNNILAYVVGFGVVIIGLAILINGFSEKNKS